MKDTTILANGTSRYLKAPTSIPETFAEWREQLLAGTATVDISLNNSGCQVVGTALSKLTLLKDKTAENIGLYGDNTVNEAFEAIITALLIGFVTTNFEDEDGEYITDEDDTNIDLYIKLR